MGHERLDQKGEAKLLGFPEAGDPKGEVQMAWHAKETLRGSYNQPGETPGAYLGELAENLRDRDMPPELRQLGRTLRTWHHQIVAWHQAQISNGPTEITANGLIKLIKRVGLGFRRFRNYRLRVLLYAARPSWDRLATITPVTPSHPHEIRRATNHQRIPGPSGSRQRTLFDRRCRAFATGSFLLAPRRKPISNPTDQHGEGCANQGHHDDSDVHTIGKK